MQDNQRPTIPSTLTILLFLAFQPLFLQRTKQRSYSRELKSINRPDIKASPFSTYGPNNTSPIFQSKQRAQLIPPHTKRQPSQSISLPPSIQVFPQYPPQRNEPSSLPSYSQRESINNTPKQLYSQPTAPMISQHAHPIFSFQTPPAPTTTPTFNSLVITATSPLLLNHPTHPLLFPQLKNHTYHRTLFPHEG